MKKTLLFLLFVMVCCCSYSQVYLTRTAYTGFFSKTPAEDIKAVNNQVYAAIDAGKKNLAFSLLLKGFTFTKELMQEHFNENYVESDKYPKASFTGTYTGDVDLTKNGVYNVTAQGNLTLHNTTKAITTPATLEVKDTHLIGTATFKAKPEDFNITIPSLVRGKIAQEITVNINADCTLKQ
jgi:hypothetical protein